MNPKLFLKLQNKDSFAQQLDKIILFWIKKVGGHSKLLSTPRHLGTHFLGKNNNLLGKL